jgi:VanZ family protein
MTFALVLALIYFFGTGRFSMVRTELLLEPVLKLWHPNHSASWTWSIVSRVRWTLHFLEFFVVFILLAVWPMRLRPLTALIVSLALAAADEGHQYFLADRSFSLFDLKLDAAGAATALVLTVAMRRLFGPPHTAQAASDESEGASA